MDSKRLSPVRDSKLAAYVDLRVSTLRSMLLDVEANSVGEREAILLVSGSKLQEWDQL
jgi:hypothetical protein